MLKGTGLNVERYRCECSNVHWWVFTGTDLNVQIQRCRNECSREKVWMVKVKAGTVNSYNFHERQPGQNLTSSLALLNKCLLGRLPINECLTKGREWSQKDSSYDELSNLQVGPIGCRLLRGSWDIAFSFKELTHWILPEGADTQESPKESWVTEFSRS